MKFMNDFRHSKSTRRLALPLLLAAGFIACSDNGSSEMGPTANGVTDIGNSVASGIVYNGEGKAVPNARVVAYYDRWDLSRIQDSVETLSDAEGRFELSVDSNASILLYAAAGDQCGLAGERQVAAVAAGERQEVSAAASGRRQEVSAAASGLRQEVAAPAVGSATQDIYIGPRRKYSGQIANRNTGAVRIVGTNAVAKLDGDGSFFFDDMPQGHITIAYVDSSESQTLKSRIEFTTIGNKEIYDLPKMDFAAQDSSWLTVSDADYYSADGHDSICIFNPDLEGWTLQDAESPLDSADVESPLDTADVESPLDTTDVESAGVLVRLSMDGSERVYDSDSTLASSINYVDGISGKGILLKPGQFIDLDTLDICDGDFTISLWTRWNGPNGEHQILVSERAYWSDSTSRFQWHFESTSEKFVVLKSRPAVPEGFAFGDSSIVPVGEWANLVLVSENNMVSMYVNGVVVEMQDADGNIVTAKEFVPNELDRKVPLRIGGNEIDTETWNGAIDEVVVENVARSAEWILEKFKMAK